jgi:hypothetical protein
MKPTRRQLVQMLGALGLAQTPIGKAAPPASPAASTQDLKSCLAMQRRDLDASQLEAVRQSFQRNLEQFQAVRDLELDDAVPPAPIFRPRQR